MSQTKIRLSPWVVILAMTLLSLSVILLGARPSYSLPQGNAITDSRVILRQALPISAPLVLELDGKIMAIDQDLKYNRWSTVRGDVKTVERFLNRNEQALLAQLPTAQQAAAQQDLSDIRVTLADLSDQTKLKSRGKDEARRDYDRVIDLLGQLEKSWIEEFPYEVPVELQDLPRLLGRAEIEFETTAGTMIFTLDGFSAPITAGNFADLVQRGFYDGLPIDRVEDFYLIQAGDPPGPTDGFLDPDTQQIRNIPMEIRIKGEATPFYGNTLDNLGYWDSEPALPFSAEGTLAMARYPDEPNSASSQFFIFMAEPDLTPAGLNLMDGRYAVFGYITSGLEVMYKLRPDDQILAARILSGSENLQASGV